MSVFLPDPANVAARLLLVVVLPTPPFPPTKIHLRVSCSRMFLRFPSNYINLLMTDNKRVVEVICFYKINIFINIAKKTMLTQVEFNEHPDIKVSEMLEECPQQIKESLEERLREDAQYYLEKKKRQQEKKLRVKKMEEDYEKQQQRKRQLFKEKLTKSSVVKEKNMELFSKKMKRNSDHFKSVISRISINNERDLERKLSLHRQFHNDQSYLSRAFSKTSKDHLKNSKTQVLRNSNNDIEKKISEITYKAERAQLNHDLYHQRIVDRIREKAKIYDEVRHKLEEKSIKQEEKAIKDGYEISQDLQKHYQRAKSLNTQKIIEKKKSVKEKLEKCNKNLQHLSFLEEERFQDLQNKFNKKQKQKEWRKDEKIDKYWQKWSQNAKKIQLQKEEKAYMIINKHHQMNLKNKIYKQKKEKLFEAIKKKMQ